MNPTLAYAEEVMSGIIAAGPWVRMACQRHLEDLDRGGKRGLKFDREAAQISFDFTALLHLPEGDPFELLGWQKFVKGSLFGWKGPDGFRRFRTGYIETGKGNGKSPLIGSIALEGLFIDNEPLAEIYAAATKKEQARICWNDAVRMCQNSPELAGRWELHVNNLFCPETGAFFRPISADKKQSGPRPHMGLIDEVHEHPDSKIIDMLRAGFKRRTQPLLLEITNTPDTEFSVCGKHRDYSLKILKKVIQNDTWFAYVCGIDEGDDWRDEAIWLKANPSLDSIVTRKYLREQVAEAVGMPDKEATVKRLNFCIMTKSNQRSINLAFWDKNNTSVDLPFEELRARYSALYAQLKGRRCYGGLDLGRVSDLSAMALYFPPENGEPASVLVWFWCPGEDIVQRSSSGIPYDVWSRAGFIEATEGNVTDFGFIEARILQLHQDFQIEKIAFDRTFAGEIVQSLMAEGVQMVEYGQGFLSMAAPTSELLRLVKCSGLIHGSHPVLRWNAENLVCRKDPAGNLKPDKERSPDKIDGISALCNAIGVALSEPQAQEYEGGFEAW